MREAHKQAVVEGYDRVAEHYLATKDADDPITPAELENLTRGLPSGAAVLDLGCGAGVDVSPLCALKPAPPEALAAMRPGCGSSPKKEDDNMPTTITGTKALDVRFPTSQDLSGSDAMNEAPDYSAAYVILKTDTELEGHGLTFTIGRGNELCVAAIEALSNLVVGETLESFTQDMGAFWRRAGQLPVPREYT